MLSTLVSDNNDLASLFTGDEHKQMSWYSARPNTGTTSNSGAMSPTSTELSDDSSLTNDDLVVLSDLFGFVTPGSNSSQNTSRPRTRKRPRVTKTPSEDGSALPKSQQQRQKQEIAFLKNQVVELQATIEKLHARKLEREQCARKLAQYKDRYNACSVNEWGISERQVAVVRQLEEQNVKLHRQVAAHMNKLEQLQEVGTWPTSRDK